VRPVARALGAIPQLLLVQPEQLSYDLAYAVALMPPILIGVAFFRQDAVLALAICFLTGIVCTLALQLARLTIPLPAWIGFKANHPLIDGLLIACFISPLTPLWVGAAMVGLYVILDTLVWPQLRKAMIHPALVVFGISFLIQRQVGVGYLNPFDARHLDDPMALWYRLGLLIDPIKLYIGNVPGPIAATSAGALLLGIAYLWYTRKISPGIFAGFCLGVAAAAIAFRYDLAFQLTNGPALFVAGYIAADRRRVYLPEQFALLAGVAAGAATVVLRANNQGIAGSWESFLLVGVAITIGMRGRSLLTFRPRLSLPSASAWRTLSLRSGVRRQAPVMVTPARQPVAAVTVGSYRASAARPIPSFAGGPNPNDMVRQLRSTTSRSLFRGEMASRILLGLALVILNPAGLVMTWRSSGLRRPLKWAISAVSVLWYLAVAGLLFLLRPLVFKA
jgi:hypothetical protein